MSQLSDAALSAYERHIPGARDARYTDVHAQYAHLLLRHLLAVADLAMVTEAIPTDVRQRVLMAITIGQPTPADAEEYKRLSRLAVEKAIDGAPALGLPMHARGAAT